jgi:hypothetical protein
VSGLLSLLPPLKEPWEQITADFIMELPESQGYNAILVAANHHTKCAHFVPSVSAVSAKGTARLFWDHMWKHHRWAQKIITDQGTQFMAKFTCALNQLLGMETALSMAYHPQMDGQTEQLNQELEQYLQLYVTHMQTGQTGCLSQSLPTTTTNTWQLVSHLFSSSTAVIHSSPWHLRKARSTTPWHPRKVQSTTPWLRNLQISLVQLDSTCITLCTMLPPQ